MSDDTPTQRLSQEDLGEELVEERKKSRTLMFVLIGIGALLLIGIIVLLVILLGGNGTPSAGPTPSTSSSPSATPTASATPTESATPTPTPTATTPPAETSAPQPQPQPDTSPGFASFNLQTGTVSCQSPADPGAPVSAPNPQMRFTWSAKNAQSVWFIFGTDDAADAQAFEVPINGDQDDVLGENSMPFPCPQAEQKMTLTVVGTNGQHVNKTFTVKNNGWRG